MNRQESIQETLLGVALVVGVFCLFFTYTGHAIIKQFLTLLIN
jgi:hypothetical protein